LHLPLDVCLRETTHRQYRTWLAWLDMQWNRPARSDHYLMRIAQALYQMPALLFGKRGDANKVKLEEMRLKFEERYKGPEPQMTKEQANRMAYSRWLPFFGLGGRPNPKSKMPESMLDGTKGDYD